MAESLAKANTIPLISTELQMARLMYKRVDLALVPHRSTALPRNLCFQSN